MTLDELRPHGDRLLVRPDPVEAVSSGGIHIPETVRADNPNYYTMTGVVVKLGDGVREDLYECVNHQCRMQAHRSLGERCAKCGAVQRLVEAGHVHAFDVAVGDRVTFGRFAGKEIAVEGAPNEWDMAMCAWDMAMYESAHGRPSPQRYLMMRELEVIGILTGNERVSHGYEAPAWGKPTSNPGDRVTHAIR